jgi:type IV pilus biogenesis protein PilP
MRAISRIALLSLLASGCAHAQPPRDAEDHAAEDRAATSVTRSGTPTQLGAPPALPQLAPLSPDFQAAMANSQLATYRYTQLTEQALALKKLCDTGFGPSDICPQRATVAGEGGASQAQTELPTVTEITGARAGLTAVLALPDGRRIVVHPGTQLPDGRRVAGISHDDVRIGRTGGDDLILPFAGAEAK